MLMRALHAEKIKLRRTPVWLAFVLLPVLPAVIGTFNYLANLGLLKSDWESLWTQHTLFFCYFFLPALLGVYCAYLWRLEHLDHNWNRVMTVPMPVWSLCLSKFLVALGLLAGTVLWQGVLFILGGLLAGIRVPIPWLQVMDWLTCGFLGGAAVLSLQLFLSLFIRSFAVPVAIALAGGIGGLMATTQGWGLFFPYALLSLGMRANNPNRVLEYPAFFVSCAAFTLLFLVLSVMFIRRRDVKSE